MVEETEEKEAQCPTMARVGFFPSLLEYECQEECAIATLISNKRIVSEGYSIAVTKERGTEQTMKRSQSIAHHAKIPSKAVFATTLLDYRLLVWGKLPQ